MSDSLIPRLAELPQAEPNSARAESTRMKCHARLARQSARASRLSDLAVRHRTMRAVEPLIAALAVAYLTEALVQALRMYVQNP